MRWFKIDIYKAGHLEHSGKVLAEGQSEAVDAVWQEYDPDKLTDLLDTTFTTEIRQL